MTVRQEILHLNSATIWVLEGRQIPDNSDEYMQFQNYSIEELTDSEFKFVCTFEDREQEVNS